MTLGTVKKDNRMSTFLNKFSWGQDNVHLSVSDFSETLGKLFSIGIEKKSCELWQYDKSCIMVSMSRLLNTILHV